jgi:hypothetical protein
MGQGADQAAAVDQQRPRVCSNLYLAKGAQEVWVISEDGSAAIFSHIDRSSIAPGAECL